MCLQSIAEILSLAWGWYNRPHEHSICDIITCASFTMYSRWDTVTIIAVSATKLRKLGSYKPVYNFQYSKYNTYLQYGNRLLNIVLFF